MPASRPHSLARSLVHGLGGCALLLSVAAPATADLINDAKNAGQKATNSVPAPPTQAQIDQAKAQVQQKVQQALTALEQRVNAAVSQQRQQLEQARQAIITQERSKVNELRRVHAKVIKLPTDTQSQSRNQPSSNLGGGLSSAAHAAASPRAQLTSAATSDPLKLDSTTTDGGGPEVSVGLIGSGFTQGCEIHFRVSASRDVTVRPDWVGSDAMTVALPADLTGLAPYNGLVYVKREDGQTSGSKPFIFRPRMDAATVDPAWLGSGVRKGSDSGYLENRVDGQGLSKLSLAPLVSTDSFGQGLRLKNSWVVDHVDLQADGQQITLSDVRQGTNDLSFTIRTSLTPTVYCPFPNAVATYRVIATGPAGLPYK